MCVRGPLPLIRGDTENEQEITWVEGENLQRIPYPLTLNKRANQLVEFASEIIKGYG